MVDETLQHLFQVKQLRLTVIECHHVDTEGGLQLSVGIQVVQNHFANRITLTLNHNAHTVFVRLVTQCTDPFDFFLFHQLSDFFDQARFVHLIRDFADDNGFFAVLIGFDFRFRAHVNLAAAGFVRVNDAFTATDQRGGWEIWTRNVVHQLINGDRFIIDVG
ncbi:Uncharacterised protein [Vibrio cholerae]|uniref:Uncharacterized protein n=1 Tax=Vibrio cholerae TaxID=666 RepID=A0A655PKY9_VIBCL|nr:Uncharacterised protein [Vibrio cholerae]CSA14091.1 Uncharacterised protein [Vibrio cholerae]CSA79866.1 Uncharacterised protein [Vibrio cholerae]CSC62032.1 Uncharacterised protein [Vibrio cholerae]